MTNFVTGNSSLSLKVLKCLKTIGQSFFGCNCDKKSCGGKRNRQLPGFPASFFCKLNLQVPHWNKILFLGMTSERVKQNSDS